MKKITVGLLITGCAVLSNPTLTYAQEADSVEIDQLIELFIALEIIAPEKAEAARAVFKNGRAADGVVSKTVDCEGMPPTRNLLPGMRDIDSGNEISLLQRFLASYQGSNYEKLVTGIYDSPTTKAVQSFQTLQKVTTAGTPETTGYGVVGPKTRLEISLVCKGGTMRGVPAGL